MEAELPVRRDRWLAKMLVSSAALAAALVLLAWATPALRLGYYGLRYRLDWGRKEALEILAVEALNRRFSVAEVRSLLGEPSCRRWLPDVELFYSWHGPASWSETSCGKCFRFENDTVAGIAPWLEVEERCVWANGLDDDSDDPGEAADLRILYDDQGCLVFRSRFDVAGSASRVRRSLNRLRRRE
jgi:hypothetical protein